MDGSRPRLTIILLLYLLEPLHSALQAPDIEQQQDQGSEGGRHEYRQLQELAHCAAAIVGRELHSNYGSQHDQASAITL